jgi:hypothetical protein
MAAITVIDNLELDDGATNDNTSTVGEPSIATAGEQLFVTGNWYASQSTDNGAQWSFVDPFTELPSAAGGFCCDQVIVHDDDRGVWIWILQYSQQDGGANVFRIAATSDADFPAGWHWWDFAPTTVNAGWTDRWFDYPDAALTADNLFVTFNLFDTADSWQRAVVMRFPLQAIASGAALSFRSWSTDAFGSLRLTQGAGSTMYWGSHNSSDQLRVFAWADNETQVKWWDVDVRSWSDTISSTCPNGVDWLGRADTRITGACVGGGRITFMWTAGSDGSHPHPYCRAARIGETDKRLVDEPDLWSRKRAWAYPATATNDAGVIGLSAFHGGADRNPGHIVGARDDASRSWRTTYSRQGSHSPDAARWGDYLTCRRDGASADTWIAAGYTLEGGETRNDILPRAVRFRHSTN